ncbi:hypothetical protein [Psychroserpens algicola]|uniref:hypothetical protein n=1 Tax=Psychroserpens algicola TaxID=1719034 RepID=UPI001954398A|nr:hypothetical protein [Psychroserpens algicola]
MIEDYNYLYTANYVIYNLAGLCVLIASIILFSKKRVLSTSLIMVGSVLAFIFNIGSVFISSFAGRYDTNTFIKINAISNIVSALAYFIFCLGLLLFVVNDYNKDVNKNEFLD